MMESNIFSSEEEVTLAYARFIVREAKLKIQHNGVFNLVLSGGNSPRKVFEALRTPPLKTAIDWNKVFFFFGDERHVPLRDDRNNALMAENELFRFLGIEQDRIFRIDTSKSPEQSASLYWDIISRHFEPGPVIFDFVMLGLGDDAHTASLFPHSELISEKEKGVRAIYLPPENMYRISLTAPLINQADKKVFLVYGEKKAPAVAAVQEGKYDPENYPAQLIQSPIWFLDNKAASKLDRHHDLS